MYYVNYNDEVLHDPYGGPKHSINDGSCHGGVNDRGTFEFTVNKNNELFGKLEIMSGEIELLNDDDIIFSGFISNISYDFDLNMRVTCDGDMARLGNVYVRPYTTDYDESVETGMQLAPSGPSDLFMWYIEQYNINATKPFRVGWSQVDQASRTDVIYRSNQGYSPVSTEIETQLIDPLGGYLTTRSYPGYVTIDYLANLEETNSQVIDFGVNILDFTKTLSGDDLYTAVVPVGMDGLKIDADTYSGSLRSDQEIRGDAIVDISLMDKYGYKEYYYSNEDINNMADLVDAGSAVLLIMSELIPSIEVRAVDLSLYMEDYKHLLPGEIVRVRSYPHDVDQYMVVQNIEVDIASPDNTTYTLGIVYDSITGEVDSKLKSMNATLDRNVDSVKALDQTTKDLAVEASQTREDLNDLDQRFQASQQQIIDFTTEVLDSLSEFQKQLDGAIMTWFYDYVPDKNNYPATEWTTDRLKDEHLGDLFYNTETGYAYRWMKAPDVQGVMQYSWGRISDTDVTEALRVANQAKDTADAKRRVFMDTPYPPYDEGDIWVQGTNGDILVAKVPRGDGESYNKQDWEIASKYSKAVYETHEEFYQSDSEISLEGGQWSNDNTWIQGKYTWRRTKVTYGDGSYEYTPNEDGVCISGNDGVNGKNGVGIDNVDVEYCLSESNSELIGGDWSTDPPEWVTGRYLWSRTKIIYSDGIIQYTDPACIGKQAADGKDGAPGTPGAPGANGTNGKDGRGITSVKEMYYKSTSNTALNGGTWQSTNPGWASGYYIWTKSIITYSDNTTTETDPVCATGATGAAGAQGPKGDKGDPGKDGTSAGDKKILVCNTASGTIAKVTEKSSDISSIVDGQILYVRFTNMNTAANPTLTVTLSTGAAFGPYKMVTSGFGAGAYWTDNSLLTIKYESSTFNVQIPSIWTDDVIIGEGPGAGNYIRLKDQKMAFCSAATNLWRSNWFEQGIDFGIDTWTYAGSEGGSLLNPYKTIRLYTNQSDIPFVILPSHFLALFGKVDQSVLTETDYEHNPLLTSRYMTNSRIYLFEDESSYASYRDKIQLVGNYIELGPCVRFNSSIYNNHFTNINYIDASTIKLPQPGGSASGDQNFCDPRPCWMLSSSTTTDGGQSTQTSVGWVACSIPYVTHTQTVDYLDTSYRNYFTVSGNAITFKKMGFWKISVTVSWAKSSTSAANGQAGAGFFTSSSATTGELFSTFCILPLADGSTATASGQFIINITSTGTSVLYFKTYTQAANGYARLLSMYRGTNVILEYLGP